MADLLAAVVQASKKVANPRAAAYASGNRPYLVRLQRPAVVSGFDRDSLSFNNPTDQVLYEGPGRLHSGGAGAELEIGDERTTFTSARLSIDQYDGPPPRVDDLVEILANAQSEATHVAGRAFVVTDVEVGGHFGTGYYLSLSGAAPSRRS